MNDKTREQIEAMKMQTIGVEVEMNNITREKAARKVAEFFGTTAWYAAGEYGYMSWACKDQQGRVWKFQRDISIHGPEAEKCEMVTPILTYEDIETLQAIIRLLRKAGAKSSPSRGCGVHIHIGKGNHTPKTLVEALEENNIFRGMATVIRTSSGTRKIPIAEDTGEASWIDEGEEIPESDATFGQTMLSAYKLGTMIKISNELLNDSAFDLATYIARRFGVRMGNAEERAFITGDGVGKPLGLLAETGGAKVGVKAAKQDAVTFDEIFKLYYALKAPYRKKAQFLCNEALVLQLMTIKDNNGNYIWKPGLEIGKPDTLLNRPLKTSAFMPEIKGGNKVMAFGDYSYYWVADRQNRTFRRLNELYARTDQVGFLTTQRVDGKLILPESVQLLQMAAGG